MKKIVVKGTPAEVMETLADMQIEADWVQHRISELTETLNIAINAQEWATIVWVATEAMLLIEGASNPFSAASARKFARFVFDEVRVAKATPLN